MISLSTRISAHRVPDADRAGFVHGLFGLHFPLRLEPSIFNVAGVLARDYRGGLWSFYALSNSGFYMAPVTGTFEVTCDNGFEGSMSSDALGLTACLYAYSQLSFGGDTCAALCSRHYFLLRELALDHPEAGVIIAACD